MSADRITREVSRCLVRVVYPPDSDMFPLLRRMPDLACQRVTGSISRVSVARALILRGLGAIDQGAERPKRQAGTWKHTAPLPIPSWVDQWIYDLADREGVAMSEIAQAALEIGRAQVLSSP